MRLLREREGARRGSWLALILALGIGAALAVLSGCSSEPSKPGGNTTRMQPPSQLPDDFPAYDENGDSTGAPPDGDPSVPPVPGEREAMWVRFRAFNDSARPDIGLWILQGGRAAAMSLDEGPPAHHAWITPDTLQIIAGWFETAGFRDFAEDSYFTGGEPGRIYEIFLGDSSGVVRRVIGDEAALPEPARLLARDLEGLAMHILISTPSGPPPPPPPPDDSTWVPPPPPPPPLALRGDLKVTPETAPAGTPRAIRLALLNETRDTVTVRFQSSQIYDLMLVDTWMEPPHPPTPPDGDSTRVPPNPPGGGPDDPPPPGGCPGGPPRGDPGDPHHGDGSPPGSTAGGHPGHGGHGEPDWPPDSTWAPPDSGTCPGDTMWVPPPDSTVTPPDRLIWNWAHDRAFEPVMTTLVLAPGGTVVYTETWDGKSNEGETVGTGGYVIMARILSDWPVMNGMARLEVTEQ